MLCRKKRKGKGRGKQRMRRGALGRNVTEIDMDGDVYSKIIGNGLSGLHINQTRIIK